MSESEKALRAIDTNILVRFIMADDEKQLSAVDRLIEAEDQPLFISQIVLIEMVWVLGRTYGLDKPSLQAAVSMLMASPAFHIERDWMVSIALDQYRRGPADFADYLIGAVAQEAGYRDTVTFDRKLRNAPGFAVLE